jgi:hypothetical protein
MRPYAVTLEKFALMPGLGITLVAALGASPSMRPSPSVVKLKNYATSKLLENTYNTPKS